MGILHECFDKKQYNKLQLHIELGHDPNELDTSGKNLLMKAVEKIADHEIRIRIIKTLIAAGINVNFQDINGKTALMIAAGKGLITELELLVKENSDINLCNRSGESALSYACEYGSFEAVDLLLANNANIDVCLHKCRKYHVSKNPDPDLVSFWIAKWLNSTWLYVCLQNVCDINIVDKNGESLLFHALHNIDSVRLLLEAGININIRNHKGETALTHAKKHFYGKDPRLVQLLIDHGAVE